MATDSFLKIIETNLHQGKTAIDDLLSNGDSLNAIAKAGELLCNAFSNEPKNKVISCGNGGSMSDAMHFAEELSGRFRDTRAGLPAIAISDVGHISCVANDFGYDQIFARFVQAHAIKGDVLFAITTSGNSANVINAAKTAKELGMKVIGLTGKMDNKLVPYCDVHIATPAGQYADRVQELHIKVIHSLIEMVEQKLFPKNYC